MFVKEDEIPQNATTKSKEMRIHSNFPDLQTWMMFRNTQWIFVGQPWIFRMDGCIYYGLTLRFCWVFSAQCANFVVRDFLDVDFFIKKKGEHIFCINIRSAARAKVHGQGVAVNISLFEMTTWILDWTKLIEIYCNVEQGL